MRGFLILIILLDFPILELAVLFKLAGIIGWWLLALLLASAIAGSRLMHGAGTALPQRLFFALQSGQSLSIAILSSFRTVLAGLLLIFPGVISDVLALLLLLLPAPKTPRPSAAMDDGVIEGDWERVHEQRDRLP